ncbi:MAG TPA: histidine triad nucleotide-binding protein [Candidatus Limnocylindria bacterium]|nr:histidine triad nucleotide-binding protein [Candidatus Limnocylindria bacterium]
MTDTDPTCLFCRIVAGDLPSRLAYTDENVVAFHDVNPQAPTHVLIVPRRHVPDIDALTPDDGELLAALFGAVQRVAADAGFEGGYRVVSNVGPDAGQSVPHLHLHVLGGRQMGWPPG